MRDLRLPRREVAMNCAHLGYYAASSGNCLPEERSSQTTTTNAAAELCYHGDIQGKQVFVSLQMAHCFWNHVPWFCVNLALGLESKNIFSLEKQLSRIVYVFGVINIGFEEETPFASP